MCSLSDFSCNPARLLKRPWAHDPILVEANGNCCFKVFSARRHRGHEVVVDPGDGQYMIEFGVQSVKKIPC